MRVDIESIPVGNVPNTFTLRIGTDDGETFTELASVQCGISGCAADVLKGDTAGATLQNTVTALYRCCKAAKDWFGAANAQP